MLLRAAWIGVLAALVWVALNLNLWAQALAFALIVVLLSPLVRAGFERLRYGPRPEAGE